jgi:hypothetical protein
MTVSLIKRTVSPSRRTAFKAPAPHNPPKLHVSRTTTASTTQDPVPQTKRHTRTVNVSVSSDKLSVQGMHSIVEMALGEDSPLNKKSSGVAWYSP